MKSVYQPLVNGVFAAMHGKLRAKYTEGYEERCGSYAQHKLLRLAGKRPLLFHAVSVGEVQAAVPLISAARAAGYAGAIVLSTTTETGKSMALRLGGGLFDLHIYYPWDKRRFVRSALDQLRPCAFVTMETELWPNMLWELKERKIPAFLANGRISDRTCRKMRGIAARRVSRHIYGLFTALFLRDGEDERRLLQFGVAGKKLYVSGDCKIDALLARKDCCLGKEPVLKLTAGGPVFIAGSTHVGEDSAVVEAFLETKRHRPEVRLIVAPRHPERAESVRELFPRGIKVSLFSELEQGWQVAVVDKIGFLFDLYQLAAGAFVGGSLVDRGGQNLLEPAVWGVPVQHGPYMDDFTGPARDLAALGLAETVRGPQDLAAAWVRIIDEKDRREKYARLSGEYFRTHCGASRRVWSGINKFLEC